MEYLAAGIIGGVVGAIVAVAGLIYWIEWQGRW